MKKTVVIIILLGISVGIGFLYDHAALFIERRSHPTPYRDVVAQYSEEYNVPMDLIYAVMKAESSFRSDAVSPGAGAIGLMQMLPTTFADLTARLGENHAEGMLYDPNVNIKYGTYYLRMMYLLFNDWDIAVIAYNAGQGNVGRWLQNPEYISNGEIVHVPFEETRNYLARVRRFRNTYSRLYFSE